MDAERLRAFLLTLPHVAETMQCDGVQISESLTQRHADIC